MKAPDDTCTTQFASRWFKRYRILAYDDCEFLVQSWRIWWPIWIDCHFGQRFATLESAMAAAHKHRHFWSVVRVVREICEGMRDEWRAWRAKPKPKKWKA